MGWTAFDATGVVYLQTLPISRLSSRVVAAATNMGAGRELNTVQFMKCFRFFVLLTILLFSLIALHAIIITLEEQEL